MPPAAHDSDHDRTIVVRASHGATLRPGTKILSNTYVIEACLGKGGMGEVYKAEHIDLGVKRAIKIILPEYAENQQYAQLFREEARKLSQVNSEAIVRYYEFARDEADARYLVMEFVDGESLASILETRRFEPAEAVRLLKRIAQGLAAAYERGIRAHRDISPANIILPEGRVEQAKVIDFGIAKSGDPGLSIIGSEFAGKYSYASPEQVGLYGTPDQVDQKSDIYSLGLVLAAAAIGFGKKLDMGTEPASVTIARQSVPDLSAVPPELRPILSRMLEPRPERRYQTMRAVLRDADRLERGSNTITNMPQLVAVSKNTSSKKIFWAWSLGGGLTAAGALASIAVFLLRPTVSADDVRAQVREVVGLYHCADLAYSVTPDRNVSLSGFVSSPEDLSRLYRRVDAVRGIAASHVDVRVRAWPFCQAAALLKPLIATPDASGASLDLASAGNVVPVGAPLVLDVRAPAFDGYAYIDYFTARGEVLHLFPNERDALNFRPARNDFTLGRPPQVGMRRCWTLGGQTGEQMVTYIASSGPLFTAARPPREDAKDYLAELSQAVAAPGKRVAKLLFFDLQTSGDGRSAGQPCSAN